MSESIFREKSLQKVKSPDNLNEYIRVSNPGIWLLMASIIILLAGFCIWGIFGSVYSTQSATAECRDGVLRCTLTGVDATKFHPGLEVNIGDLDGTVEEITLQNGQLVCVITSEQPLEDGFYPVEIVMEEFHPISFLVN